MSRTSTMFKNVVLNLKANGDIGEVGVLTGTTFRVLCRLAKSRGVLAHAFDSFRGLSEPTAKDLDSEGKTIYPKGRFDIGGVDKFHKYMKIYGISRHDYKTWEGFVPHCFDLLPKSIRFAYIRLDLDQYEPTKRAAEWALERLCHNGILSSHDYFPTASVLAAKAMADFVKENGKRIAVIGHDEDEIYLKRIA